MADQLGMKGVRLFLEEICADLLRFRCVDEAGAKAGTVRISREVDLGGVDRFADLRLEAAGRKPCFAEIKYGYDEGEVLSKIARKYAGDAAPDYDRLVVVLQKAHYPDWARLHRELAGLIRPSATLEIWDEQDVLDLIKKYFAVEIDDLDDINHTRLRQAIDRAKWEHAFGAEHRDHSLMSMLLWHFSHWSLHELATQHGRQPNNVLHYGVYRQAAVVMTDLCGFSGYVRDTKDDETIRQSLTSFYSAARHAIHDAGGMFYQFIGDAALGIFGLPERVQGYERGALDCARAMIDVGASVSNGWQSHIDRLQPTGGVRVGIAVGDLNLLPLRPYSRLHIGFISDTINMAARLMAAADPGQIVVSNSFYSRLPLAEKARLQRHEPVEAKNVGLIQCWKMAEPGARGPDS